MNGWIPQQRSPRIAQLARRQQWIRGMQMLIERPHSFQVRFFCSANGHATQYQPGPSRRQWSTKSSTRHSHLTRRNLVLANSIPKRRTSPISPRRPRHRPADFSRPVPHLKKIPKPTPRRRPTQASYIIPPRKPTDGHPWGISQPVAWASRPYPQISRNQNKPFTTSYFCVSSIFIAPKAIEFAAARTSRRAVPKDDDRPAISEQTARRSRFKSRHSDSPEGRIERRGVESRE